MTAFIKCTHASPLTLVLHEYSIIHILKMMLNVSVLVMLKDILMTGNQCYGSPFGDKKKINKCTNNYFAMNVCLCNDNSNVFSSYYP